MQKSSYFIENRALMGSFPTKEDIKELVDTFNVKYFVDLTEEGESYIEKYQVQEPLQLISYPIQDKKTPKNWRGFAKFILTLERIINTELSDTVRMYIHCKGGHGRTGIVVACLLGHMKQITSTEAIEQTTIFHNKRPNLKPKWIKYGAPQNIYQKNFVHRFLSPLYFYKSIGPVCGFSNFSHHSVTTSLGVFKTSEAAYHAHKCPMDKLYVENLKNIQSPSIAKKLSRSVILRNDWENIKKDIMYMILRNKFETHEIIRNNLLATGLRPLYEHTDRDLYWGDGGEMGGGQNHMGKILSRVRDELYLIY